MQCSAVDAATRRKWNSRGSPQRARTSRDRWRQIRRRSWWLVLVSPVVVDGAENIIYLDILESSDTSDTNLIIEKKNTITGK